MGNLVGTWWATELFTDKPTSGKFIKFNEDHTYVVNDGLSQAESTYETPDDSTIALEPAFGTGSHHTSQYQYKTEKADLGDVLTLSQPEKGIVLTFIKNE